MPNKPDKNLNIPKNYFRQAVLNLQWGGIPINDIKHPILKYVYYVYVTCMLVVFLYFLTITEVINLYENYNNIEIFLFTMSYLIAHLIGCAKITVLLLKRKSIRQFLKSIEEGQFLPNIERGGNQEIELIKGAVFQSASQTKMLWFIIFIMLSNRVIWIIINPTTEIASPNHANTTVIVRQLPYATSYIIHFDMYRSPFYELVFIHQIVGVWNFGWLMGNADCITNGLMIHLTAQLKILSNAFGNIIERAQKLTETEKSQCINKHSNLNCVKTLKHQDYIQQYITEFEKIPKYEGLFLENLQKCIRDCIQHHQDLLNLSQNMEDTFNLMFLMQFTGCLTVYSFQLYQLSLMSITSTSFISMCFFLFAMIFQVLLFCWNGNELSIASEAVADAAYNSEWVPANAIIKNHIQMVIQRAQRPVHITAGKFSVLSMETFAAILKGSVSYFMVLRKVNTEEKA